MNQLKLFYVNVPANIYDGRYFDFQSAPVLVCAANAEEAGVVVNNNKCVVCDLIATRKVRYGSKWRYLIPYREPVRRNVFFKENPAHYGTTEVKRVMYPTRHVLHMDGHVGDC